MAERRKPRSYTDELKQQIVQRKIAELKIDGYNNIYNQTESIDTTKYTYETKNMFG